MPNSTNEVIERAIVLDAGGVAGMAWIAGLLSGLKSEGCDLSTADMLIGSSLSGLLAAQVRNGVALETLFPMQALALTPHSWQSVTPKESYRFYELWAQLIRGDAKSDPANLLEVLLAARAIFTPSEWKSIVSEHIFLQDWPTRELKIIAIDCVSGQPVVFDRLSDTSLLDAIAASSATPGLVYPIKIDGRYCADGGLCSPKNIGFAEGAKKVVVISPMGTAEWAMSNEHFSMQIEQLKKSGSEVMVVVPDYPSRVTFEDNPFLVQTRVHAAEAGLVQGIQLAQDMSSFWLGIDSAI